MKNQLNFSYQTVPFLIFIVFNDIKFYIRSFLFLVSGIFVGLYLSLPGILISENW